MILQILKDKRALAGVTVLIIFGIIAALAPYIAPFDPWKSFRPGAKPSKEHLLGTDLLGRDVFSQLVWGARTSLLIGFSSALGILFVGLVVGFVSALSHRVVDEILMRVTDIVLYIPKLPLLIFLAMLLGRGFMNVIIVLIATMWPQTARIIRSEVLTLKQRTFVEAAKVAGAGLYTLIKIMLPHVLPLTFACLINLTIWAVVYEASLSFLGLGDPSVMSWGTMFHFGFISGVIYTGNYLPIVMPGICIVLLGLGMHAFVLALQHYYTRRVKLWHPF